MKKLIVEAEVSLDGVVNSPDIWPEIFKYHSDDLADYLNALLARPDALVLGRKTYEVFAHVWPQREGAMADRINGMPKYVASRTLKNPLAWNAHLIERDVVEKILKLKQEPGDCLLQYGIGELTNTALRGGAIDELQLIVFPFTFGKGERWFDVLDATKFQLMDCRPFHSGALLMRYQPVLA